MRRSWPIPISAAVLLLNVQAAISSSVEIPFDSREGLLWIHATIGATNRVNLLLDTGAGASVINRGTADRLGLKRGAAVNVRGVSATFTGYKLRGVPARAGDVPLPADYIALDLSKLSSSCAQPVDGLLGADFFRARIVQIDFEARRLRIFKDAPNARSFADTLPLQLRPCGMRVPISVNGRKSQWVRLDTGCVSPLQWVTSNVRPEDCMRKTAIGLTELSIPQIETTVQIGRQHFDNVPTGLHEHPIFAGESGLLGNGLLSRFSRVTIDAKSRLLILEP